MFTIKQVVKDPDCSRRSCINLWEGTNVSTSYNEKTERSELHFIMLDGATCTIDAGVVYVMNSSGKTVETARLAGSEWF